MNKTVVMQFNGADSASMCADAIAGLSFNFTGPLPDGVRLRLEVDMPDGYETSDILPTLQRIAQSNRFSVSVQDGALVFHSLDSISSPLPIDTNGAGA